MSDQSKAFRQKLSERYYIVAAEIEQRLVSKLDGTAKYLLRLPDGEHVECVLMEYHHGYSICISSQVGCKMNCSFCATGKSGFSRNLTASEMLSQIQTVQQDQGIRISNVVLMGMGEPLDNYQNVLRFLELVSSDEGMNIGMRHISLSTCGIVDKIYDLAERKLQLTLSVSLHAPNDAIRSQTMPVNNRWGVDELLTACRAYAETTGRRISFEYAMISGVNDTAACAKELATRLHGMLCHHGAGACLHCLCGIVVAICARAADAHKQASRPGSAVICHNRRHNRVAFHLPQAAAQYICPNRLHLASPSALRGAPTPLSEVGS